MDIGGRIKEFAKKKHGGVGKLAKALGISQPQLSQYISGVSKPGAEILTKLANLGADINYILTGEGSPMQKDKDSEILKRLDALEREIKELKAELYDKEKENEKLRKENERIKEENKILNIQIGALNRLNKGGKAVK